MIVDRAVLAVADPDRNLTQLREGTSGDDQSDLVELDFHQANRPAKELRFFLLKPFENVNFPALDLPDLVGAGGIVRWLSFLLLFVISEDTNLDARL